MKHSRMKKATIGVVLAALASMTIGCGKSSAPSPSTAINDDNQPGTLTFRLGTMNEDQFTQYVLEPAKKKFPNFTFNIDNTTQDVFTKAVAAGAADLPDIVVSGKWIVPSLIKMGMIDDISDLVKQNNIDLSVIDPVQLTLIKDDLGGTLGALPLYGGSDFVMYYNKDLFDKFGVNYPKDGMSWDDVYELAKRMTRTDGGVMYRGYTDRKDTFVRQDYAPTIMGVDALKQNEDKSNLDDPRWVTILNNFKRFYTLPGLNFTAKSLGGAVEYALFKDGTSAMTQFVNGPLEDLKFNWDIVSAPYFKEKPGVNSVPIGVYNYVVKTSKNKAAAMRFMKWVLSNEEQTILSKSGYYPAIKDDGVKKVFMQDRPEYKGKNVNAFLNGKFADPLPPRKTDLSPTLEGAALGSFYNWMPKMILENIDVNTIIRNVSEEINKAAAADASN